MHAHQGFGPVHAVEKPLGAYGLQYAGLPAEVEGDLSPVALAAPLVTVEVRLALDVTAFEEVTDDHVFFAHERGPRYEFRRAERTALMSLPAPPNPRAVVHPLLTLVGGVFGRWRGAVTLHGGAFALGAAAWAVLADKDGGKSTTLAGLLHAGVQVLADDLVVVEAGSALAGPRSVDLRAGAAEQLGVGEHIGFVGGRYRHRVHLPPPPASAPLAGIVVLEWGDSGTTQLSEVALEDKLRLLHRHQAWSLMGPPDPEGILGLAVLPMLRLSRPRVWANHEQVTRLLTALA